MPRATLLSQDQFLKLLPDAPARGRFLAIHGYGQTREEMLPLASHLARGGWEVWLLELPGHGTNDRELSAESAIDAARGALERCRPDRVLGYSLGARLALALSRQPVAAISPPVSVPFDRENRAELLAALRPRWVRESRPMQGLADALQALDQMPITALDPLVLVASKDLNAVRSGNWNAREIRDTDHGSILFAPETARQILDWSAHRSIL